MIPTAHVGPAALGLFAALYALQGVVVAYFFNFNQGYMEAAGVPAGRVGWVQSLAMLPFVLKFLAGPLSDRVNLLGLGHRKPYIVLGLIVQAAGLAGLATVDPGRHLGPFVALAILAVAGLALYDTCCDGMVIDLTPPGDRARIQGTIVAARFLATTVCSLGFGRWLERTGTGPGRGDGVLWACVGLGVLPLILAWIVPDPPRADDRERFRWSALGTLARPRALALLAFGAIYATLSYGVEINLSPYYTRLGFGAGRIGDFAAARYLGRAAGAALLPVLAARVGRRGVIGGAVLALAATTAGQAAIGGRGSAAWLGFAFGAANGWSDALFSVLAMEASDPRLAASTYALIMAVSNVGSLGGGLFASAVDALGGRYRPAFLLGGALNLIALALVIPLARRPAPPTEPDDARPA